MQYSIGDTVTCKVEIFGNGKHKLLVSLPKEDTLIKMMEFQIIGLDAPMDLYKILIPDYMTGWMVSKFHVEFQKVDPKYLGKFFYDIPESLILGKVKKSK